MTIDEKEKLAHTGDMGIAACAIRLRAARITANLGSQKEFAAECGVGATTLNNMEMGKQYPNRTVMKFLYRGHRIDFNFLMNGDFSQLPADVQELLFPNLVDANSAWDQTKR